MDTGQFYCLYMFIFRRGKPMYLSHKRYNQTLRKLWISFQIENVIADKSEGMLHDIGTWETM
jgi:hypothetical protein